MIDAPVQFSAHGRYARYQNTCEHPGDSSSCTRLIQLNSKPRCCILQGLAAANFLIAFSIPFSFDYKHTSHTAFFLASSYPCHRPRCITRGYRLHRSAFSLRLTTTIYLHLCGLPSSHYTGRYEWVWVPLEYRIAEQTQQFIDTPFLHRAASVETTTF